MKSQKLPAGKILKGPVDCCEEVMFSLCEMRSPCRILRETDLTFSSTALAAVWKL